MKWKRPERRCNVPIPVLPREKDCTIHEEGRKKGPGIIVEQREKEDPARGRKRFQ